MTSDRIAIVLIANQAYTEQLTVTMKSIMYHNKSVDFYIINQGIMTDWFRKVRRVAKFYEELSTVFRLIRKKYLVNWEFQTIAV